MKEALQLEDPTEPKAAKPTFTPLNLSPLLSQAAGFRPVLPAGRPQTGPASACAARALHARVPNKAKEHLNRTLTLPLKARRSFQHCEGTPGSCRRHLDAEIQSK